MEKTGSDKNSEILSMPNLYSKMKKSFKMMNFSHLMVLAFR